MKKEFLSYELAVKLQELGFDEPCLDRYDPRFGKLSSDMETWTQEYYPETLMIPAPLYQQAFRWFREKYMLVGVPTHQSYDIWNTITGECFIEIYPLNSYEEAELACLTKLIEIVEQQKQK